MQYPKKCNSLQRQPLGGAVPLCRASPRWMAPWYMRQRVSTAVASARFAHLLMGARDKFALVRRAMLSVAGGADPRASSSRDAHRQPTPDCPLCSGRCPVTSGHEGGCLLTALPAAAEPGVLCWPQKCQTRGGSGLLLAQLAAEEPGQGSDDDDTADHTDGDTHLGTC